MYSCLSCLKNDIVTGELREIPLCSSVSFVMRLYEMLVSKNYWKSQEFNSVVECCLAMCENLDLTLKTEASAKSAYVLPMPAVMASLAL